MKDIARDLGISAITVSKALRHHPDISEPTRQRVLERVKELNYQPNFAARALITGRAWTFGLVVPDLLHPFFSQIAKSMSAEIRKRGYSLIISSSEEDPELEQEEIQRLLARGVDALLIASCQRTVDTFRRMEEQESPYVLIDRKLGGLAANFVGVDDEEVGMIATAHLIEQGCTRISHIRGPDVSTALGRLEGYRRALAQNNMTPSVTSVGGSGDDRGEAAGYDVASRLVSSDARPDGIFCYNDPVAIGAMRAILAAGLRIPKDVAVVGCGNLFYSDFIRVPLTTVDQGSEAIGERAAKLGLRLAESKKRLRPKTELISPRLVVRASSQRQQISS